MRTESRTASGENRGKSGDSTAIRRALASLRASDPAPCFPCGTSPLALRGEGRTARPSCDREPTCPPTRQRRLQVLKGQPHPRLTRSEEHTSELQSLMRISYAVFCLKKTQTNT